MGKRKYNRLSEVLKEKGWTQQQLADKLGTTQQMIGKYCSNTNQMGMERLFTIAEILEVDVCDLLERGGVDDGGGVEGEE